MNKDKRLELHTESLHELSKKHFDEFMKIFNRKILLEEEKERK